MNAAARMLRLAALCCGVSAAAGAAETPTSLTLHFDFFYNGLRAAEVTEVFSADENGGYEITSHAAALGLAKIFYGDVVRKSVGRIDRTDGLRPLRYEEKRGKRPQTVAEIDEKTGEISLRKGDETRAETAPDAPLTDYLSALYRPYILKKMTPGRTASTDGWRLKVYEYMAGDPEEVQTAAGVFSAIPLFRESPRGRRVLWFAPSLGYIPVKTHIDDKGHIFEAILTKIGGDS
ncbi:MAG: DUF3108 domain-containing protein [Gammaproteobacteria bacterium]